MYAMVLNQIEDYFKRKDHSGLAELAKTCNGIKKSLMQGECLTSESLATELVAIRLLLAEIFTRQALLTLHEEYSPESALIANQAYQQAITNCNNAIAALENATENNLRVDRTLLRKSNSFQFDDPGMAKAKIKELVYEPLKNYLSQDNQEAYYTISRP